MLRKNIFVIAFVSTLFLTLLTTSVSWAHGDTIVAYEPVTIVPGVTIPLWGPTWAKENVTVRVDRNRGVTAVAIMMVEQAIDDWNHAIFTKAGAPFPFLSIVDGDADIIIKVKKGGGMVQGQALCDSTDGFFNWCKINVSGRAFGSDNPDATVLSIALQELGHAIGLLHADNSDDVMYGSLQSPANTKISHCDLDAWAAVMNWLLLGFTAADAYPPTQDSVSCGITDGGGDTLTGTLDVGVEIVGDTGPYSPGNKVLFDVTVSHVDVVGVEGATVHVTVYDPSDRIYAQGNGITGSDGTEHFNLRLHRKFTPSGIYTIDASATKDNAEGACSSCASFEVK